MTTTEAPLRPLRLLGALWLFTSACLALPGWLLLALSEGDGGRRAGGGIAAAAALAFVTGLCIFAARRGALRLSYAASMVVAIAGLAAVAGVKADGPLFGRDAMLVGGLPLFLAALTAGVAALNRPKA